MFASKVSPQGKLRGSCERGKGKTEDIATGARWWGVVGVISMLSRYLPEKSQK